jgi:hypothetical protein
MRTAIALVNPNSEDAITTLTLRDPSGNQIARQIQTLRAHTHIAQYLSEMFSSNLDGVRGSLTFESDQPLGAAGLFEVLNGHGESVYTTCPVNRLDAGPFPPGTFFPHLAARRRLHQSADP